MKIYSVILVASSLWFPRVGYKFEFIDEIRAICITDISVVKLYGVSFHVVIVFLHHHRQLLSVTYLLLRRSLVICIRIQFLPIGFVAIQLRQGRQHTFFCILCAKFLFRQLSPFEGTIARRPRISTIGSRRSLGPLWYSLSWKCLTTWTVTRKTIVVFNHQLYYSSKMIIWRQFAAIPPPSGVKFLKIEGKYVTLLSDFVI